MKRLLYLEYMNLGVDCTLGIKKKVLSHIDTFQKNGFTVYYVYIDEGNLKSNFIDPKSVKLDFDHLNKSLSEKLKESDFTQIDYAYIRFSGFTFKFMNLLNKIHGDGVNIILEIPTFPFIGEYMQSAKGNFVQHHYIAFLRGCKRILLYPLFSCRIKKYVDRIVTFSEDNKIWGIETIRTCNGISLDRPMNHIFLDRPESELTMICASSCLNWHGYDRVIEGMKLYYEKDQPVTVYFKIIGEGPESENYKRLIKKYHLEKYITLYGNLNQEELDEVYKTAHVAIDSMGRHRVGVYYNSSLKGKEYAYQGLPIVSGVRTELDDDVFFPYYLRVSMDNTPIQIEKIVEFVKEVEKHENFHAEIQSYAVEHFGYDKALKPIIDYMNENLW